MAKGRGMSTEDIFKFFDKNGDGQITADEFSIALQKLGPDIFRCTDDEIRTLVAEFDDDGNGEVSMEEFKDWCYQVGRAGPPRCYRCWLKEAPTPGGARRHPRERRFRGVRFGSPAAPFAGGRTPSYCTERGGVAMPPRQALHGTHHRARSPQPPPFTGTPLDRAPTRFFLRRRARRTSHDTARLLHGYRDEISDLPWKAERIRLRDSGEFTTFSDRNQMPAKNVGDAPPLPNEESKAATESDAAASPIGS